MRSFWLETSSSCTRTSLLLLLSLAPAAAAALPNAPVPDPPPAPSPHTLPRADQPITIDGRLDEAVWKRALTMPLRYEIDPGKNVPSPVETTAYLLYDANYVYAAFRADDPEPKSIRAHLTDRDTPFRDDWVGIFLDTFNDQRRGYEFFVNPFGVQMDLTLDETSTNDKESSAWDGIWKSAGQIDERGYTVEIAIPYSSLRFQRADGPQIWGLMPFRSYPRSLRHQISPVPFDPDNGCTLCQITKVVGFDGATPGRNFELDPTATAHRTDVRDQFPEGGLTRGRGESEAGLTARWGITPNLTLAGTVNPDFSQVEADAAQLSVNTDFSLFFEEKRPFFLEGFDFFSTPLNIVHTRTVADPKWGLKLAGKEGRHGLGVFVAQDDQTSLLLPGNLSSTTTLLDGGSNDAALRYRTDLGSRSNLGALYTHRDGTDYQNDVLGFDGIIRPGPSDRIVFQALGSRSQLPHGISPELDAAGRSSGFDGSALRLGYSHDSLNWNWYGRHEQFGRGFRADLGFIPRVGTRYDIVGLEHTWRPSAAGWYTSTSLGGDSHQIHDSNGRTLEREVQGWVSLHAGSQSFFFLNAGQRDRFWNGRSFDGLRFYYFETEMRPGGSLYLHFEGSTGDAIDFANTRRAKRLRLTPSLTYDAGRHLRLSLDHDYQRLEEDGRELFTANLSQLRAVYQINLRCFVRTIFQYSNVRRTPALYIDPVDAKSESLFSQLLFAYKLNPQTVLFVGYSDNQLGSETIDLTRSDRTLFLKLGYAFVL